PEALVQGETLELRKGQGPGRRRYGDLRRLGTRLVAARIVRRDLQGGGRAAGAGTRMRAGRRPFPRGPADGAPRPRRQAPARAAGPRSVVPEAPQPFVAGRTGPAPLRGHDLPPSVAPVGQRRGLLWPGLAPVTIVHPAPRADLLVHPDNRVERHSPAPPGARRQ